jgi:hypothetical protein
MKKITLNRLQILFRSIFVTYGLLATFTCRPVDANTGEIAASKDAVVRDLCSNNGKLSRCVGLAADDCPSIVRPFVDKCSPLAAKNTKEAPVIAFQRCFWSEYLDKYEKDIRNTPDCVGSEDKEPLKKLPPEIEREYELLSAFEEREDKAAADKDKKSRSASDDAMSGAKSSGDF